MHLFHFGEVKWKDRMKIAYKWTQQSQMYLPYDQNNETGFHFFPLFDYSYAATLLGLSRALYFPLLYKITWGWTLCWPFHKAIAEKTCSMFGMWSCHLMCEIGIISCHSFQKRSNKLTRLYDDEQEDWDLYYTTAADATINNRSCSKKSGVEYILQLLGRGCCSR